MGTKLKPLLKMSLALTVTTGLGFAPAASADFTPEGWYTGQDANRAMEAAESRGLPIAVIYSEYDST